MNEDPGYVDGASGGGHGGCRRGALLEPMVLAAIALQRGHGYDLSQRITELTSGRMHADVGGLYRVLRRLEDDGCVVSTWHEPESGARRREYEITAEGLEIAEAWIPQLRERAEMNVTVAELLERATAGGSR